MLDLSADYLIIDDPLTILLHVRTSETTYAPPVEVAYAQKERITQSVIGGDSGDLDSNRCLWHVWRAQLGGVVPKVGDKVEHDSTTWNVREVGILDRDSAGPQRYHLTTNRE